ncbi:MAG: NINE protein [Prevotellaceae bacterium]|nr:NINE protein [Prevotellaceae bacterium]
MNKKSKLAAALFALFLGGFGAHKFYLGQIGKGIIYLVFCWTGIPSIIAFIEFILYLCMSDEEFDYKYNAIEPSSQTDVADEINKLYDLKERGAITEEEYQERKNKLL